MSAETIIQIEDLGTYLGGQWVHNGLDLDIKRGEILGIVGGSGTGKTTLLYQMLMLRQPDKGRIKLFGEDVTDCGPERASEIRKRFGMMFQQGALFTSFTVLENVAFQLAEFTHLSRKNIHELARVKISLSGLPLEAAYKYPAELSGGMLKRAAVARAMAMDPEVLFFDEPTAGLDPQGASALDELILQLNDLLGLTIIIVTHDLDTLWRVTDRVAFLGEGKVLGLDTMTALSQHKHPLIYQYFHGLRGTRAEKEKQ